MTNNSSADDAAAGEDRILRARVHLLPADGLLTEPPQPARTSATANFGGYCPTGIQYAIGWNAELADEISTPHPG